MKRCKIPVGERLSFSVELQKASPQGQRLKSFQGHHRATKRLRRGLGLPVVPLSANPGDVPLPGAVTGKCPPASVPTCGWAGSHQPMAYQLGRAFLTMKILAH